ncbi:lytic polysaccharide monooxygenase auxiliary activity family 9 protein [Saccharomonospora saliphila]|uniref:lytic polysaccharide monooxygenase auxiliary activity family 9 protein n=1 Tax=Saccharomonospora saliphila TaxID=369829 RepID=UPI000360D251|nr:lytic polysaccharide monooxygenase [Saccharomonospora saliphila]
MAKRFPVVAAATLLILSGSVGTASAHGSVTDPPSRVYGCYERWGENHQSPDMATEDPLCHQAWESNPKALWNWNGLYRNGVDGDHRRVIPDGQLCSAGRAQDGRYAAFDAVGEWKAAERPNDFTINVYDGARHGADYYRVYITKQGFDPTLHPLGWGDLRVVAESGPAEPAENTEITVNAGDRTGRHIVYTIWKASHMDQTYYFCSDVIFEGR